MGLKSNSNHFKGTNGTGGNNTASGLTKKAQMPQNKSQLSHIMRDAPGHLPDTPENREKLEKVANDQAAYLGKDENGVEWYAKNEDGKQIWASVKDGIIQNGGSNDDPVEFVPGKGLKKIKIKRRK